MTSSVDRVPTSADKTASTAPQRREIEPDQVQAPVRRPSRAMTPHSLAALQRSAGNAAVAGMVRARGATGPHRAVPAGPTGGGGPGTVGTTAAEQVSGPVTNASGSLDRAAVQRLAGSGTAPPVPPPPANPHGDPKFAAAASGVRAAGQQLKKHPPPAEEVGKAQAAAKAPPDDKTGQAKAAQVDAMAAAKPGGFDKAAFIAAVRKAIAATAPQNLDEADKFATSGKADGIKSEVMGKVTAGKDASAKDVKDTAAKPPDPSVAKDKPVTPLADPAASPQPAANGAAAMPGTAPPEQVNFGGGPAEVDQKMKDAQVTEQQLEKSNEPELQDAAKAKKQAEIHAATAPTGIRQTESATLQTAQQSAGTDATKALAAMAQAKTGALGRVAGSKSDTQSKDEAERARISGEINRIFDATKTETEAILNGLDGKVTAEFDRGEAQARSEFTAKHKADMERYKDERYAGPEGWARWTADLFTGLPAEANLIYERAKALYESKMTVVITTVADLIGKELDAAKARISRGRQEIKDYVAKQPAALQKVAAEAGKEISGKFEQLESDVDSKQQSLVDDLAAKYVEARNRIDEEIKAEQESNKGLVDKAKDAVAGAVDAILKLKALFMGLLAKAAGALSKILDDPVTFIGNFMSAVKQGFMSFAGNILTHLKKGLLGWLFGALSSAGIELPESFDIKGILKMVASILGLTWANIKSRILKIAPWVAKIIDVVESKIEVFTILATQGVAGLWTWIKEKLGDLKEMILTPIKEFVIEKIVTAGITWVLGMLNPAGALVKIVQALVGVVQWIMERGAGLMDFIGTVVDAVSDIAAGGVGGVPAKIEASLSKAVPLVISFLAGLLGLGGISDKIKSILQKVQKPINQAIDAVIKGALKLAGPLIKGIKGIGSKVKAKALGGDDSPEGKQKRLDKGLQTGVSAVNRFAGKKVADPLLRPLLGAIRVRYGLQALEPVKQGVNWAVSGVVSRMANPAPTQAQAPSIAGEGKDAEGKDPASKVDPAKVKTARRAANGAQSRAAAAYSTLRATMADAPPSAREAIRNATFACGPSGVPQMQGGGSIDDAVKDVTAAFRHRGAEHHIETVKAEAQKEAWLHDKSVTPEDVGGMFGSAEQMRAMRERMRGKNVYVPGGSARDRGIFQAGLVPERKRNKATGELEPTGKMREGKIRVGTDWGSADAVHAEKLEHGRGSSVIGVSRPMCAQCQAYFASVAKSLPPEGFIIVDDGARPRIFLPGGKVGSPFDF